MEGPLIGRAATGENFLPASYGGTEFVAGVSAETDELLACLFVTRLDGALLARCRRPCRVLGAHRRAPDAHGWRLWRFESRLEPGLLAYTDTGSS